MSNLTIAQWYSFIHKTTCFTFWVEHTIRISEKKIIKKNRKFQNTFYFISIEGVCLVIQLFANRLTGPFSYFNFFSKLYKKKLFWSSLCFRFVTKIDQKFRSLNSNSLIFLTFHFCEIFAFLEKLWFVEVVFRKVGTKFSSVNNCLQ